MKILLAGISGKMGSEVYKNISNKHEVIGFDIKNNNNKVKTISKLEDIDISKFDLLIDFTEAKISKKLILLFLNNKKMIISGTTGLDNKFIEHMKDFAKKQDVYFYHTVNFAKTFHIFKDVISDFKANLPVVEIIESHNITKKDKPSGSAKVLADVLQIEYGGVKALRNHENEPYHLVIFSSPNEKVYLMHQVINRNAFIEGFLEVFNELVGE